MIVKPYRSTAVDFQTGSAAPAPRIHSSVMLSRRTNSSLEIKNNNKIIDHQELVLPSSYYISYVPYTKSNDTQSITNFTITLSFSPITKS